MLDDSHRKIAPNRARRKAKGRWEAAGFGVAVLKPKERSAVEPVASALVLVDAGAVALEGADEGFAAEVADEAVDLAGFAAANGFFGSRLQARRMS